MRVFRGWHSPWVVSCSRARVSVLWSVSAKLSQPLLVLLYEEPAFTAQDVQVPAHCRVLFWRSKPHFRRPDLHPRRCCSPSHRLQPRARPRPSPQLFARRAPPFECRQPDRLVQPLVMLLLASAFCSRRCYPGDPWGPMVDDPAAGQVPEPLSQDNVEALAYSTHCQLLAATDARCPPEPCCRPEAPTGVPLRSKRRPCLTFSSDSRPWLRSVIFTSTRQCSAYIGASALWSYWPFRSLLLRASMLVIPLIASTPKTSLTMSLTSIVGFTQPILSPGPSPCMWAGRWRTRGLLRRVLMKKMSADMFHTISGWDSPSFFRYREL